MTHVWPTQSCLSVSPAAALLPLLFLFHCKCREFECGLARLQTCAETRVETAAGDAIQAASLQTPSRSSRRATSCYRFLGDSAASRQLQGSQRVRLGVWRRRCAAETAL